MSQPRVCLICDEHEKTQIVLHCGHHFCLICTSYMVLKSRANGNNYNDVPCGHCHKVSNLDQDSLELIQETIQERLIPQLDGSSSPMMQKGMTFSKNQVSVESFDNKTPSTNILHKHPRKSLKQFCKRHPLEELAFVCVTCNHHPLCLKCILSNQHPEHEVKSFSKAVQMVLQRLDLLQFQLSEGAELIEFKKRTLKDRQTLLLECWEKSRKGIEEGFQQVQLTLERRQAEMLERCNKCYEELSQSIDQWSMSLELNLERLNNSQRIFHQLEQVQEEEYSEFLELYQSFKKQTSVLDELGLDNQLALDISVGLSEETLLGAIESINGIDIHVENIREKLRTELYDPRVDSTEKYRKPPRPVLPNPKTALSKFPKKLPQYVSSFLQKQRNHISQSNLSLSRNTFEVRTKLERSRLVQRELQGSGSMSQLHRRKSPLDRLKNQKQLFQHKKSKQF